MEKDEKEKFLCHPCNAEWEKSFKCEKCSNKDTLLCDPEGDSFYQKVDICENCCVGEHE